MVVKIFYFCSMVKSQEKAKIKLTNGEEIILKDFFYANYPVFNSFAAKYIPDTIICEDIVQDIFIKFWESRNTFFNIFSVKAFFYKSIRNSCLDYIKHQKVKDKYIEYNKPVEESTQYFWEEVIRKEAYSIVYKEINKLPKMGKQVLLCALAGKNNEEIAQELGISVNTVKTHKSRAYQVLRKKLIGLTLFFMSLKNNCLDSIN